MSKAHGPPQHYIIYAIIVKDDVDNYIVHINKTVSKDLNCVLRRHTSNNKNKLISEDFRLSAYEAAPTIHELETVYGDAALAYRHVLGWVRKFDDAGFVTLIWPGMEYHAYHFLPETADIYQQQIKPIPLQPLLAKPYVPPPKSPMKPTAISNTTTQLVQLNIRIDRTEFEAFQRLCKENNLTQREGIVMLLENYNPQASNHLILEQKQTIVEQVEKIQALTDRVTRLPRGVKADIRLVESLDFLRAGIARYIELSLEHSDAQGTKMKCLSWNQFDASGFDRRRYQYPETDGYTILKLEAMCYGHGRSPAIFLWGINEENNLPIKVRFYNKRIYMGLSVPHSPYLKEGNLLLIGHKQAPDGAADMYMALPLMKNATLWKEAFAAEGKKVSLDELIRNANRTNI